MAAAVVKALAVLSLALIRLSCAAIPNACSGETCESQEEEASLLQKAHRSRQGSRSSELAVGPDAEQIDEYFDDVAAQIKAAIDPESIEINASAITEPGMYEALTLFKASPKVELHTHLDGALQPTDLCEMAIKRKDTNPELLNTTFLATIVPSGCRLPGNKALEPIPGEMIPPDMSVCPELLTPYVTSYSTETLTDFLQPFVCIGLYVQFPGGIKQMASTLVDQQARENTVYTDTQAAPQLLISSCDPFSNCELDDPEMIAEVKSVTEEMIDGLIEGEANHPGITVNFIADCMRDLDTRYCRQMLDIAIELKAELPPNKAAKLVGVNLAGAEDQFPNDYKSANGNYSYEAMFGEMTPRLRAAGLFTDPHSAEPNFNIDGTTSADDCWTAQDEMKSNRIGHGYQCTEQAMQAAACKGVMIEAAPASSKSTGAVRAPWSAHPIRFMEKAKCPDGPELGLSLATDDRAVIGTTMTSQLGLAKYCLGFDLTAIAKAAIDGITWGFTSNLTEKSRVCEEVRSFWMGLNSTVFSTTEVESLDEYLQGVNCIDLQVPGTPDRLSA